MISPNSTIDYYQQLIATVGRASVDQNVRFYTVPGMGHGTGSFIPNWDSLAALEGWVERGLAPATGVAVDAVAGTYGRTRPLCQYPAWPKYRGSGSLDAAVNYSCVTEAGDPLACPNLPATASTFKGGNSFGEELSVTIDPSDHGLCRDHRREPAAHRRHAAQRFIGGARAMQLRQRRERGGVQLRAGRRAARRRQRSLGRRFRSAAGIPEHLRERGHAHGVQPRGEHLQRGGRAAGTGVAAAQAASVRLRNAGTFQYCRDPVSGGFMVYDANCTQTEKGYISYNATRKAFDLFTTLPTGGATTSGGTLTGSMVIGLVNGSPVPLHLVRESAANAGLRMFSLQQSLMAGAADGSYAMASVKGESHDATVSGSALNLGGAAAALSYDTPVPGAVQADAGRPGQFHLQQRRPRIRLQCGSERGAGTRSTPLKNKLWGLGAFALLARSRRCCPRTARPWRPGPPPARAGARSARAATPARTARAPSTGSRSRRTGTACW